MTGPVARMGCWRGRGLGLECLENVGLTVKTAALSNFPIRASVRTHNHRHCQVRRARDETAASHAHDGNRRDGRGKS